MKIIDYGGVFNIYEADYFNILNNNIFYKNSAYLGGSVL
jgi:hypothetical protein